MLNIRNECAKMLFWPYFIVTYEPIFVEFCIIIFELQSANRQNKTLMHCCFVRLHTANLLTCKWILTRMLGKPWWLL